MVRATYSVLLTLMGGALVTSALAGTFEDLGVPVTRPGLMGCIIGPDETGEGNVLYFSHNQEGALLYLVGYNVRTGEYRKYRSPQDNGAWGLIVGPDKRVYLGTWGQGLVLRFDPEHPEREIEVVGRPSETETYIWMYTVGQDGKLYGCTYGNCKLVSFDPATGELADLGRVNDGMQYSRSVATAPDGRIIVACGYGDADVVAYDPATGDRRSLTPADWRGQNSAAVWRGADGQVYAVIAGDRTGHFRVEGEALAAITAEQQVSPAPQTLADGRVLVSARTDKDGDYAVLRDPQSGAEETIHIPSLGDGSGIFVVGAGPNGTVYGSTAMPCEFFRYDPATGQGEDLGRPGTVDGEVYSILEHNGTVWNCAYPGSELTAYDPARPWAPGPAPDGNPRNCGPLGPGHLRPRAMILGPNECLYIGSYPEYGKVGGAMAVFDIAQGKVVENYHHLIRDQAIVSLAYEPESGLIWGGSSIAGCGGSSPTQAEARIFAFSPETKQLVLEEVPIVGDTTVVAMCAARGRTFAVSEPSNTLIVYEGATHERLHQSVVPFGPVHEISLGPWQDGLLYGLAGNAIFSLDPETYEMAEVARHDPGIGPGFALTDDGVYFGLGVHLYRYKW